MNVNIEPVLKAAGADRVPHGSGWRKMMCPFHDDSNPSASVNLQINGFKCHSCGVSGDSIKLIRDHWGKTYTQAVEFAKELDATTSDTVDEPRKSWRLA